MATSVEEVVALLLEEVDSSFPGSISALVKRTLTGSKEGDIMKSCGATGFATGPRCSFWNFTGPSLGCSLPLPFASSSVGFKVETFLLVKGRTASMLFSEGVLGAFFISADSGLSFVDAVLIAVRLGEANIVVEGLLVRT